jgi:hypothetical protein
MVSSHPRAEVPNRNYIQVGSGFARKQYKGLQETNIQAYLLGAS